MKEKKLLLVPQANKAYKLHMVDIAVRYPKTESGSGTLMSVLGEDAKVMATKIINLMKNRSTVNQVTVSSNFASVTFIGITVESEWGAVVSTTKAPVLSDHMYNIVQTDLNTGKDVSNRNLMIKELTYSSSTTLCMSTFATSLYRAAYILELSKEMEQKNPGAYSVLRKNFIEIGDLPYISAKLPEKFFGSLEEAGFIFSNLLPFPNSSLSKKLDVIPNSMNAFFNTYSTRDLISSLFVNPSSVNIDDAVEQLNVLNAAYFAGNDPELFLLSDADEVMTVNEEVMSHITGRRQELQWVFSQFSRFFEFNGAVEASKINSNLRFFQQQLKTLVETPLNSALYFEDSPRDLFDFSLSWFNHTNYAKDIYYLLMSLDPSKSNYELEYISGNKDVLNAVKPYYRTLSPGLILMNNTLLTKVNIVESLKVVDQGAIVMDLTNRAGETVQAKLISISLHDADIKACGSLVKIISDAKVSDVRVEMDSILAITMWLCNGDPKKGFGMNKVDNTYIIKWPAHVLRRYIKSSIFEGSLKLWIGR